MNMNINQYFKSKKSGRNLGTNELARRIVCVDGFSVSVQANEFAYCSPRDNRGPYYQVELGYQSDIPTDQIMEYCEDPKRPTDTIYGYVPVELVEEMIKQHGGMAV